MWRTKLVNFVFWIAFSVLCVYAASDTDEDNLRTITKRDCYEKLTEGHRLNHKDVFRSLDVKTVEDCQIACTEEKLKCRALAFGLVQDESGDNTTASSNTTKAICELGETPIKETSDLKPIGTIMDKDFNLYIKTLDCTIAMDFDTKFGSNNPSNQNTHEPEGLEGKPTESTEASTQNSDGAQKVQTVVAISPGLKKQYLHPVHQILMGEAPHRYAQPLNGRPLLSYESYYKPSLLDGYSQGPYAFGRPHDTYGYGRPGDDVDGSKHQVRPGGFESYPQRPQTPFHYDERPHRPIEYEEPARPPLDYGSGSQRPTDYVMRPQRPPRPNDHGPLPQFDYGSRPHQPDHYQERPQIHGHYNPLAPKPSDDYGSASQKPTDYVEKPQGIEYEKPHRPNKIPQGPQKPLTGYGEKPQKPPASYENKPQQPSSGYKEKPLIYPSYGEKTEKPNYQGYIPGPQEPQGYNEKPYSIVSYPQGPVYNNRPPHRPDGYDRPQLISRPGFHDYDRPNSADRPLYHVPRDPPRYDILRPNHDYDVGFLRPQRPAYDSHTTGSHYLSYHDEYFDLPHYRPIPNRYGSYIPRPEYYEYYRPKPINEYMFNQEIDRYDPNPGRPADLNPRPPSKDPDNPNLVVTGNYGRPGESLDVYHKPTKKPSYPNQIQGPSDGNKPKVPHSKPIVTQSIGPHGETITSIIEEWKREKYPGNKPRDVSCGGVTICGKDGEWESETGECIVDMTKELEKFGPDTYISEYVCGGPKNYAYEIFPPPLIHSLTLYVS